MISFDESDEQKILRKTVRDFAAHEIQPYARAWDEEERYPLELVPKLAELCLIDLFDEAGILSRRATSHADPTLDRIARQTIGETHAGESRSPYYSQPIAECLSTSCPVLLAEEASASVAVGPQPRNEGSQKPIDSHSGSEPPASAGGQFVAD